MHLVTFNSVVFNSELPLNNTSKKHELTVTMDLLHTFQ